MLNGSLWSLGYEMLCYLGVAVLAALGVFKRVRALVLVALIVACALILWNTDFGGTVWWLSESIGPLPFFGFLIKPLLLWFGTMFLMGAVAALYADRIPVNDVFGLAALVTAVVLVATDHWSSPAALAFGYVILWSAIRLPPSLQWIGQRNDYSYGVYIYAFLVQQVLASFGVHRAGFVVYTLATLLVTSALAWASWHLVEKRAMRLKEWTPQVSWLRRRPPVTGSALGEADQPTPATPAVSS